MADTCQWLGIGAGLAVGDFVVQDSVDFACGDIVALGLGKASALPLRVGNIWAWLDNFSTGWAFVVLVGGLTWSMVWFSL